MTDPGWDYQTADLPSSFAGADAAGAVATTVHRGSDAYGDSGHARPEVCMTRTTNGDVSARRAAERAWLGWKVSRTSTDVSQEAIPDDTVCTHSERLGIDTAAGEHAATE